MIERKNNSKKKLSILLLLLFVLIISIFSFYYIKNLQKQDVKNTITEEIEKDNENKNEEVAEGEKEEASIEISEEEKKIIESQEGVTLTSDGIIQVDISKIEEEMKEVKEPEISKENAIDIAKKEIGEGSTSGDVLQKEHDGKSYWAIQVLNKEESFWVYVDDATGEILFTQKES